MGENVGQMIAAFTPGAAGIWTLVLMAALYGLREWRETRKLSLEDRLARRDGYAKQVDHLMAENRQLRQEMHQMNEHHEAYRKLCHQENDQLRTMVVKLQDDVAGLNRRIAQDANEIAKLKGYEA